jgi:hypothetical protein
MFDGGGPEQAILLPCQQMMLTTQTRRSIMVTKSKIAVIAAVLGVLSASPAFAQSFDSDWGTGNETPTYYGPNGGLHMGIAPHNQIAAHRSGLNAFASIGPAGFASDNPSNTRGGSLG